MGDSLEEKEKNLVVYKTLENTQTAVKIYQRIKLSYISMLSLLIGLFTFYLLFFLTIQDKNWYDWMIFVELFDMLACITLLASSTDRAYQSFYYVLAASAICFTVNIVGIFAVRIPDLNNVTGSNARRKYVKEILLYMQIAFTIYDFGLFILSFYYRFLSKLDDDVLARFVRISESLKKYMQTAILYDIKQTAKDQVLNNLYSQAEQKIKEKQTFDIIREAVGYPKKYTNPNTNANAPLSSTLPQTQLDTGSAASAATATLPPSALPAPVIVNSGPLQEQQSQPQSLGFKYNSSNNSSINKNTLYDIGGNETQSEFSKTNGSKRNKKEHNT